jgi:HTH-type transcriptional regulator/antitoxin HigA
MKNAAETFHPGEFLKDELEVRNWSQAEFAEIIGRPARLVNEIIGGKKSITPETAVQIGDALGTGAELWLNLDSQYQLSKVRPANNAIRRKSALYALCPVRDMTKRGWIGPSEDIDVLEAQVLSFYRIKTIEERPVFSHAARKTSYDETSMPQFAWLFRAKQIAETQVLKKYKRELLVELLPKLEALRSAPEEARHVSKYLSECGICFVVVEAFPSSKIDGACFWLEDGHPVIALSLRLDRIDNFWFVLRHEIEHVLQEHGKDKAFMIDEDIAAKNDSDLMEEEKVANDAASNFCVDRNELSNYIMRVSPYVFAEIRVVGFARRLGIDTGIVVGQLQKKFEKWQYLRRYLVKIRHVVIQTALVDGWGTPYPLD